MKTTAITIISVCFLMTLLPLSLSGQTNPQAGRTGEKPDDITQWKNKTIMWVGPHQDDEAGCMGTLSLLKANGNKLVLVWYRRYMDAVS
ncbi:MAG: PIG-L family deacetylase [Bacteroidales bacterium]|nr:PIG-L family deacetylase [Bacteroidales bacterium]